MDGGSIGKNAFYNSDIQTAVLNNVTVGERAFAESKGLESVTLNNATLLKGPDTTNVWDDGWEETMGVNSTNGLTVTMYGGSLGEYVFNKNTYVTKAVLHNMDALGQFVFYQAPKLASIELHNVKSVATYATFSVAKLASITLDGVGRVNGNAFYGCKNDVKVIGVDGNTQLGYISADKLLTNDNIDDIVTRVDAIFDNSLTMDAVEKIVELTTQPDEWDDGKVAEKGENWETDYNYATQLVEQARWTNPGTGVSANTEAEVQVDAYYTAPKQMDFVFVADLSNSMTELGNVMDQNARFYDMQSKLQDVTDILLNAGPGYDCQVAIVTFGGAQYDKNGALTKNGSHAVMNFTNDADNAKAHINGLTPLYENTDYGLGMNAALELVQGNNGRNTTVVFLSDGAPNKGESDDPTGVSFANSIKAISNPDGTKVQIFGVLHSPTGYKAAKAAMDAVCTKVFESKDTDSFGKAMNLAFAAVYPDCTVTIPVNENFKPVNDAALTYDVNAGTANVSGDGRTITWTITGMPFTKHTLTYHMALTDENAARYGDQSYPVNSGNAVITNGVSVENPCVDPYRARAGGDADPAAHHPAAGGHPAR